MALHLERRRGRVQLLLLLRHQVRGRLQLFLLLRHHSRLMLHGRAQRFLGRVLLLQDFVRLSQVLARISAQCLVFVPERFQLLVRQLLARRQHIHCSGRRHDLALDDDVL